MTHFLKITRHGKPLRIRINTRMKPKQDIASLVTQTYNFSFQGDRGSMIVN